MNTAKYISELLAENNCVVVPGLGGFLATRQHSTINQATQMVSPPAKKVSFNRMLSSNDGLLIKHIADATGLGFVDAEREVTSFVKQCHRQMEQEGVMHIPDVGKLYINNAGQMGFAEVSGKNLLADSFGLPTAHYTETFNQLDPKPVDKKVAKDTQRVKPLNRPERSTGYWLQLAATVIVIATLSILMTRDVYMEQLTLQNLGFVNLGTWFSEDLEIPATLEAVETTITNEENTTPAELPVVIDEEIPLVSSMDQAVGYYMVWASFSEKSNAEKFIKRQANSALEIMSSAEGYYRVVQYASTQSMQADNTLNTYRTQYQPSIWLLYNMH